MLLGRLAARAGRIEEALELLRSAERDMGQYRVDFYAQLARALIVEAQALGGDASEAIAGAASQLAGENSNVSLLRRARGVALARTGDRDGAIAELRDAVAVARDGGEDFDLALALDALALISAADPAEIAERDAILSRLGVVSVPPVSELQQPLAVAASG
jgi:tetratricopeptide (TPR) repeat protein